MARHSFGRPGPGGGSRKFYSVGGLPPSSERLGRSPGTALEGQERRVDPYESLPRAQMTSSADPYENLPRAQMTPSAARIARAGNLMDLDLLTVRALPRRLSGLSVPLRFP
jgi:hypothetical protein